MSEKLNIDLNETLLQDNCKILAVKPDYISESIIISEVSKLIGNK